MDSGWSAGQYRIFRVLFGCYLAVHFGYLLPWVTELFSQQGMLSNPGHSPLFNVIPNVLALSDTGSLAVTLAASGFAASLCFALGWKDKWAAGWMLYVLICFFGRNPLIANPAMPYVGFMLLAHLFVGGAHRRVSADEVKSGDAGMVRAVYLGAVIVLALSYSYSGYTKLLSPSWVAGDTVGLVLQNPLARDYWFNDFLQSLPDFSLQALTWFILIIELLYAPLAMTRGWHKWLWLGMLLVQFGFLFLLSFPDLTIAMILFHLFTFKPSWIGAGDTITEGSEEPLETSVATVFYDGDCGFCHGFIAFLVNEDTRAKLMFAPLNGDYCNRKIGRSQCQAVSESDSMLVSTRQGAVLCKSDAVIYCLGQLGGLWLIAGRMLSLVPRVLRNWTYDQVGKVRRSLMPEPTGVCPVPGAELRARFVL